MITENPNSWQSQANGIIQYLLSHKYGDKNESTTRGPFSLASFRQGYLFEHEITDEIAPKYHLYVRRPIALDTIRKTLESNAYPNKEHFKRDIYLMLYNAMKYNPRYHHVHRSAKHLFQQACPLFSVRPRCRVSSRRDLLVGLDARPRHSRANGTTELGVDGNNSDDSDRDRDRDDDDDDDHTEQRHAVEQTQATEDRLDCYSEQVGRPADVLF
jgi:hypothetical protein